MGFPNKISYDPPIGFPGEAATSQPLVTVLATGPGFTAAAGGVSVGRFVWLDTTDDGAQESGWKCQTVGHTSANKDAPLGVVLRRRNVKFVSSDNVWLIPEGSGVLMAKAGDIFVITETAARVGQNVYAKFGTGTIVTQADGKVPSGTIETSFTVAQGGAAGELVIITSTGESTAGGTIR